MEPANKLPVRGTNVDLVFDHLYDEINTLGLLPGSKISEADIAARFGVSRQPVRDAFSRLENYELVVIRPKKATEVRKFSMQAITKSRFIRAAIEVHVLRNAAANCDTKGAKLLDESLKQQRKAVAAEDFSSFQNLDYDFHKTLCDIAAAPYAFEVIAQEKTKLDRLCSLSHSGGNRLSQLLEDHEQIASNVKKANAAKAIEAGELHLSRLDDTIKTILEERPEYFEQES